MLFFLAGCMSEQALVAAQTLADYHLYAQDQLHEAAAYSPGDHYSTTIQPDGDLSGFALVEVDRVNVGYQEYSDEEIVVTYRDAGLVGGEGRWSGEGLWDIDLEEDVHVLDIVFNDEAAALTIWLDGDLWLVEGTIGTIPVPESTVRRVPDEDTEDSGGCRTAAAAVDGC